jgi:hypothetical protein
MQELRVKAGAALVEMHAGKSPLVGPVADALAQLGLRRGEHHDVLDVLDKFRQALLLDEDAGVDAVVVEEKTTCSKRSIRREINNRLRALEGHVDDAAKRALEKFGETVGAAEGEHYTCASDLLQLFPLSLVPPSARASLDKVLPTAFVSKETSLLLSFQSDVAPLAVLGDTKHTLCGTSDVFVCAITRALRTGELDNTPVDIPAVIDVASLLPAVDDLSDQTFGVAAVVAVNRNHFCVQVAGEEGGARMQRCNDAVITESSLTELNKDKEWRSYIAFYVRCKPDAPAAAPAETTAPAADAVVPAAAPVQVSKAAAPKPPQASKPTKSKVPSAPVTKAPAKQAATKATTTAQAPQQPTAPAPAAARQEKTAPPAVSPAQSAPAAVASALGGAGHSLLNAVVEGASQAVASTASMLEQLAVIDKNGVRHSQALPPYFFHQMAPTHFVPESGTPTRTSSSRPLRLFLARSLVAASRRLPRWLASREPSSARWSCGRCRPMASRSKCATDLRGRRVPATSTSSAGSSATSHRPATSCR